MTEKSTKSKSESKEVFVPIVVEHPEVVKSQKVNVTNLTKSKPVDFEFNTPSTFIPTTGYNALLLTQQWKRKRNIILIRDHNRCQYCGCYYNLQVHHKYYSKYPNGKKVAPWNYPDDALITLCDSCHKKVHERKKIKVYYRKYDN